MEEPKIIFWLFIGIFSITAILTFLGITGVIKSIKENYLKAMFTALILEVVAAVVLSYKQLDFSCDSDQIVDGLWTRLDAPPVADSREAKVNYLEEIILEHKDMSSDYTQLQDTVHSLVNAIEECNLELTEIDKDFYTKVIRLRKFAQQITGSSINLVFDQTNKQEAFTLLYEIFQTLGRIDPGREITTDYIISVYVRFVNDFGLQESHLEVNEDGNYTGVYVTDYSTSIIIRIYLQKFYPVRKTTNSS